MILDTGVLLAAAVRTDRHHRAAVKVLQTPGPKVVPEPVVTETASMMASRLGQVVERTFVRSLLQRPFVVEPITRDDRVRVVELLTQYADGRIGYVDAAVAAVAERLGDLTIATLDRRDFTLIRPRSADAFVLLP